MTDSTMGATPQPPEQPYASQAEAVQPGMVQPGMVQPGIDLVDHRGNIAQGLAFGTLLGALAAAAYVTMAVAADREFLALAVLMGVGVGWGIRRYAQRRSIALGIVAVVVTAALFVIASFTELALVLAREYDVAVADAAAAITDYPGDFFATMTDEFLDYIWIGAALLFAFLHGSGVRDRGRAAEPEAPEAERLETAGPA